VSGCSPTIDIFGYGDIHYLTEEVSQEDPMNTLLGKLKLYCPSLFESLTSWERDVVDSSGRLKRSKNSSRRVEETLESSLTHKQFTQEPTDEAHPFNVAHDFTTNVATMTTSSSLVSSCGNSVVSSSLVSHPPTLENFQSITVSTLSLSPIDETTINLGCRESKEDEASLSVVFDSLLPFICD